MPQPRREQRSQTQAHDTYEQRRRALRVGLKKGCWSVGIALLLAFALLGRAHDKISPFWLWVLTLGGTGIALVCIGYLRWHAAKRDDESHHALQKVPSMPIRLVRDHDDVWIEGRLRCPRPVRPPGFRRRCIWFHLVVEEKRGSGKNEHWVTVRDEQHGTTIWITDATREIEVDMRTVSVDYPEVSKRNSGSTRTSLRHIRADGVLSACGLARYRDEILGPDRADERDQAFEDWRKEHEAAIEAEQEALASQDKQERLAAQGRAIRADKPGYSAKTMPPKNVWHLRSLDDAHGVPKGDRLVLTPSRKTPLVITPLPRHHWHDHAEADELALRTEADIVLGFGIPAIVWTIGVLFSVWPLAFWPGGAVGLVTMLVVLFPPRLVRLYNRFVAYRQRIRAARADLDADFELRSMLLPQLQALVLAFSKHEKRVQKHLAALRSKRDATDTVIALRESTPQLEADDNFASLADDITAVEEKIAFGRAQLQDAIAEYNTLVQRFPANLLAGMTGFQSEPQAEGLLDDPSET